jgi:hypothetical protein
MVKFEFQMKMAGESRSFSSSTMRNTIFLVAMHPVSHFLSVQHFLSTLVHQGRLSQKKNHGKRARFDGEIAATELDLDMAGRSRDPVTDSYGRKAFIVRRRDYLKSM